MEPIVLAGLLGGIGGLTRGVVGLLKALSLRRRIIWGYYAITVVIALIIGVFVGIIFDFDPRLSLLAGYAGTDILEGIYKSFKVDKTYVKK
jgi:fluoride ion exporter CrcB/FEX